MSHDDLHGVPTADGSGRLRRLDARVKLIAAGLFVIAVVATPLGAWGILSALGAVLLIAITAAGVPPLRLLTRWLTFLAFAGLLAAVAVGESRRPTGMSWSAGVLFVAAKNSMAFLMMLTLAQVASWVEILGALRKLRTPAILVGTLAFMGRYIFVLHDEADRMRTARRARSFRKRGNLGLGVLASLIGGLLIRAMDREERVFGAMTARGWDGTMRSLDD